MTKETIDKVIKTIEIAIAPAIITAAGIWGFDVAVYVGAVTSAVVGVLACIKQFIKE